MNEIESTFLLKRYLPLLVICSEQTLCLISYPCVYKQDTSLCILVFFLQEKKVLQYNAEREGPEFNA